MHRGARVGRPRVVDLFCGTGGFSLGAHAAGMDVVAAFDNDPVLTSSYETNFPGTKLILRDISSLAADELLLAAGGEVDGLIGGPPCQGFSSIGKRDPDDPRRKLLLHFFRLVADVVPTFFVMENVQGLAYRDARPALDEAIKIVRPEYRVLGPMVMDAGEYGAATVRKRLFVIGIRRDQAAEMSERDLEAHKVPRATVRQAIADLAGAERVGHTDGFDVWRTRRRGRPTDYASELRGPGGLFTGHEATAHSDEVRKRFGKVGQGEIDRVGRHPRLAWAGQCPNLRAGTGPDRGSFQSVRPIHPDEDRVITVREAARLQGFPDSHLFHPTVWHSFRMIGNSVSPKMSLAILTTVLEKLRQASQTVDTAAE